MSYFVFLQIKPDERWENLSEEKRNILISYIGDFPVNIMDTESFDRAQTTVGGIPLEDINVKTMESKIIDNLYIVGELLDVDGKCGGYNPLCLEKVLYRRIGSDKMINIKQLKVDV